MTVRHGTWDNIDKRRMDAAEREISFLSLGIILYAKPLLQDVTLSHIY
jgi:hypothetical protein